MGDIGAVRIQQRGYWVDYDAPRIVLLRQVLDAHQVNLGTPADGAGGDRLQDALVYVRRKADSDRCQIADQLVLKGVEADIERFLAEATGRLGKAARQRSFGGPRGTRQKDTRSPVVSATQHGVEPLHPCRHAFTGDRSAGVVVTQDGGDVDAGGSDDERCRILLECTTAILCDAQTSQ